jgi:hypothetical protein
MIWPPIRAKGNKAAPDHSVQHRNGKAPFSKIGLGVAPKVQLEGLHLQHAISRGAQSAPALCGSRLMHSAQGNMHNAQSDMHSMRRVIPIPRRSCTRGSSVPGRGARPLKRVGSRPTPRVGQCVVVSNMRELVSHILEDEATRALLGKAGGSPVACTCHDRKGI